MKRIRIRIKPGVNGSRTDYTIAFQSSDPPHKHPNWAGQIRFNRCLCPPHPTCDCADQGELQGVHQVSIAVLVGDDEAEAEAPCCRRRGVAVQHAKLKSGGFNG